MVTGITPNEYLRNRRLSQAAQELMTSDVKVIDLALKYGYETPESFTKAFSRFHGVTPSLAKRAHKPLILYNRLILKFTVEGGTMMQYRIEERAPFKVAAYVKAFPNTIIGEADNQDIPNFWDELINAGKLGTLKAHAKTEGVYGLCQTLDKTSQTFNYGVGMQTDLETAPEGLQIWEVKPTLWAVFECVGDDGACIGEVWDKIFKEFLPNAPYDMLEDVDFEYYPEDGKKGVFCEVWIPVVAKGV
jgi:AraC family transcriptional regulator